MSQKSQISGFYDSQQPDSENDNCDEVNDNDLSQIQSSSSKEASTSPPKNLRPGFLPAIVINSEIDPSLSLIKELCDKHQLETPENEKFLFESIFSLYALLAYGGLSSEQSRTGTWEASIPLVTHFQSVMDNIHMMAYMQKSFIDFLPGRVIPTSTLQKLSALKTTKLIGKFAVAGAKPENLSTAKQEEIILAQLGDKANIILPSIHFFFII